MWMAINREEQATFYRLHAQSLNIMVFFVCFSLFLFPSPQSERVVGYHPSASSLSTNRSRREFFLYFFFIYPTLLCNAINLIDVDRRMWIDRHAGKASNAKIGDPAVLVPSEKKNTFFSFLLSLLPWIHAITSMSGTAGVIPSK